MKGDYVNEASTIAFYPRIDARLATVTAKTADYTVTVADLKRPTIFTNSGASGTVVFSLPKVKDAKGKVIRVHALAAQIIRLDANGTEAVNYNGSVVAGKYANIAAVIGNFVEAFCDGTQWIITHANGVVTKEA